MKTKDIVILLTTPVCFFEINYVICIPSSAK